jgi:hypothetical protein
MPKKTIDQEIDELFDMLPSDEEIKQETRKEKISKSSVGKQKPNGFSEKLSNSKKGKALSEEHLESIRASAKLRKGTSLSEETRAKLSLAGIGREVSEETRAKISSANKGRKLPPVSEEVYIKRIEAQKISYANGRVGGMKGKTHSDESRAKISFANKGKKNSQEHCSKISESKKGKSFGGNLKSIITPYGTFASIKEAGEFEEIKTGKKFNPNRFTKLLKDPNSGYKKI